MKGLFQKIFGRAYTGAMSMDVRHNPTMGLALHLFYTGKGNAVVRRTAKHARSKPVKYIRSRKERY